MKNKKYVLMIAGAMSILQCFAAHAGIWAQDGDQWKYQKDDGTYAEYEWVQDSGDWYYCSRWGNMEKNTVIDGYYLGADGRMIPESDTENPLYGETVYSTCYMQVNSYEDWPICSRRIVLVLWKDYCGKTAALPKENRRIKCIIKTI